MNKKNDSSETESEISLNIRRCHVCDFVTESQNGEVERCQGCNKYLAPFFFCESTYTSDIKELSKSIFTFKNSGLKSIYPPLLGIALYW
jgi:hypothetical protein